MIIFSIFLINYHESFFVNNFKYISLKQSYWLKKIGKKRNWNFLLGPVDCYFSQDSNRIHKRGRICKSFRLVPTKIFDVPTALLCSLRIMGWIRLHRRKLWETIGSCFMAHVWGPQKAFQKNFHPICGFYKITSVNLYDLSS